MTGIDDRIVLPAKRGSDNGERCGVLGIGGSRRTHISGQIVEPERAGMSGFKCVVDRTFSRGSASISANRIAGPRVRRRPASAPWVTVGS